MGTHHPQGRRETGAQADEDREAVLGRLQVALERVLAATRSNRRHRVLVRRAGGDLTRSESSALARIVRHGPLRLSVLSELLDLDRSMASRQVDVLVRQHLVERVPDPTDGRAHLLHATDEGRRLSAAIRTEWAALMDTVLQDWPQSDLEQLTELMGEFGSALHRSPPPRDGDHRRTAAAAQEHTDHRRSGGSVTGRGDTAR